MGDPLQRGNIGVGSHHYVCIYYFGLLGMISEGEVEKMSKKEPLSDSLVINYNRFLLVFYQRLICRCRKRYLLDRVRDALQIPRNLKSQV